MYRITGYEVKSISNEIEYMIPKSILKTNVQSLWDKGYYGKGIHIAVLDSGCDVNHACLSDRIVETKNFINNTDDVKDSHGHGTHVAGIIAANKTPKGMTGIAPECNLHIYKVLDNNGNGNFDTISNALEHAINQGEIDIVNMSLGGSENNQRMHDLIKKANEKGICIVCASGNEANGDDGSVDEYSYPGFFQESIETGSIEINDSMSKFSNSNANLDVVSYGGNITSCYPNDKYATTSGTSQSSPLISGALALLKQKFIDEFGRKPDESELYAQLIKNTKTLQGVSRKCQGNGYLYFKDGE